MKRPFVYLSVAFAISLGANVYLFKLVADWQKAWLEQILTTADIERLYRKSGADVSFSAMKVEFGYQAFELYGMIGRTVHYHKRRAPMVENQRLDPFMVTGFNVSYG